MSQSQQWDLNLIDIGLQNPNDPPLPSLNLATKRHNKSNIGITKHQHNGGKMQDPFPKLVICATLPLPPSQVLTGDAHGEAPQQACCVARCVTRSTPQGTCLED